MKFQAIGASIIALLGANANGQYYVAGHRTQKTDGELSRGNNRIVMITYSRGSFSESKSGTVSPQQHDMEFVAELQASSAAKVDLSVIDDENSTEPQLAAALAEQTSAAFEANKSVEELYSLVWNTLIDPRNIFFGGNIKFSNRRIGEMAKDDVIRRGKLVTVTGRMLITCTVPEDVPGAIPAESPGVISTTMANTYDNQGNSIQNASIKVPLVPSLEAVIDVPDPEFPAQQFDLGTQIRDESQGLVVLVGNAGTFIVTDEEPGKIQYVTAFSARAASGWMGVDGHAYVAGGVSTQTLVSRNDVVGDYTSWSNYAFLNYGIYGPGKIETDTMIGLLSGWSTNYETRMQWAHKNDLTTWTPSAPLLDYGIVRPAVLQRGDKAWVYFGGNAELSSPVYHCENTTGNNLFDPTQWNLTESAVAFSGHPSLVDEGAKAAIWNGYDTVANPTDRIVLIDNDDPTIVTLSDNALPSDVRYGTTFKAGGKWRYATNWIGGPGWKYFESVYI